MNNIYFIIIGMMIVTYIPRVIPFFLINNTELPTPIKNFLEYVPYTALGALLIPGIFTSIPGNILAATLGFMFAIVYSFYRNKVIFTIIGSILVVYLVLLI